MTKSMFMRLLSALIVLVLVTSACGGDDDTADGTSAQEPTDGEPTAIPTPTPASQVDNTDLSVKPLVEVPAVDPPSDLETTDLVIGSGEPVGAGDLLITQYVGVAYSTGLQFDASWERGTPFLFTLGEDQVIDGWEQGIVGMAVGGRRQLVIPPDLAYGEAGRPDASSLGSIGPNETLVFVVDLVGVVPSSLTKPSVSVPAEPAISASARPQVQVPADLGAAPEVADVTVGTGTTADSGDLVAVRYVGVAASNGEDVDSAWNAGPPVTFTLGDDTVVQGLSEGIVGMAAGGRRELVVPPDLAYGAEGSDTVGPNEALVYVVDLVGVVPGDLTKPDVSVPDEPATALVTTDITEGAGPVATAGSTLLMHYVGVAQSTGEEFDESWSREPFVFTLGQGQVIRGWDDGIEGMAQGGRRELVIPADQAYGEGGSGSGSIGPNETLVFVVDLLGVVPGSSVSVTDIVEGQGPEAEPGDVLSVHYVGVAQSTGEQFDASWDRGVDEIFTFALGVGQVIPGWDQGLQGMKVGGRRELVIPPDLAYGEAGAGGGLIAPNESLVFVVDLVAVS